MHTQKFGRLVTKKSQMIALFLLKVSDSSYSDNLCFCPKYVASQLKAL